MDTAPRELAAKLRAIVTESGDIETVNERKPHTYTMAEFTERRNAICARILAECDRARSVPGFADAMAVTRNYRAGVVRSLRAGADAYGTYMCITEWCRELLRLHREFPAVIEYSDVL